MVTKVLFLIAMLCLQSAYQAFVLNKRSYGDSSNKLADALRVIQTQKRKLSEKEDLERQGGGGGYYGDNWGYGGRAPSYGNLDRYEGLGGELSANQQQEEEGGRGDLYEDYDQLGPDAMKLMEYYYDLGQRAQEPELDGPIPIDNGNDITEVDQREIQQLLDTDKEKKNIDWTPKALGFEGLKHKRGEVTPLAENEVIAEDTANESEDGENLVVNEGEEGPVEEGQLTDEEVNKLLSDVENTEVKSVSKQVEIEDVNGEKTVSGKEVTDILKDTDGDGQKEELVLEKDVPPTKVKDINKELLMGQELVGAGGSSMKQKRAGGFLEESPEDYLPMGGDFVPTEQDLLRECLVKYIELEDRENTALAEALNWATKAQYDQTDAYIPMQVEYLRKAVTNEATLADVRRQCFDLASQVNDESELEDELAEEEEEDIPMLGDPSDVIDEEPIIEEGDFLPDGETEEDSDLDDTDFGADKPRLDKEELANYITNELIHMLSRKQEEQLEEEQEEEEGGGGEWMDNAVDDTQETGDQESEWQLNPFLRELILRYKEGKLEKRGEESNMEDNFDDYEMPEEPIDLQSVTPYVLEDDSDLYDLVDSCPAVDQFSDDCAYAQALGWALDEEAVELCNRHLVCYVCGADHHLTASVCDKGFLGEAYSTCEVQDNSQECMDQADLLFELMFKTHPYSPHRGAHYSCKSQCTLDYIIGNLSRRK